MSLSTAYYHKIIVEESWDDEPEAGFTWSDEKNCWVKYMIELRQMEMEQCSEYTIHIDVMLD